MNWTELRPLLRTKFGRDFYFYNDVYRNGTRRIKICTQNSSDMLSYIKELDPKIDAKLYRNLCDWDNSIKIRVTIHYR